MLIVNSSSRDAVPMEQKVDEAMVAVGDETGLKKLIGGDLTDSDSSDEEDDSKLLFLHLFFTITTKVISRIFFFFTFY